MNLVSNELIAVYADTYRCSTEYARTYLESVPEQQLGKIKERLLPPMPEAPTQFQPQDSGDNQYSLHMMEVSHMMAFRAVQQLSVAFADLRLAKEMFDKANQNSTHKNLECHQQIQQTLTGDFEFLLSQLQMLLGGAEMSDTFTRFIMAGQKLLNDRTQ